MRTVAEGRGDTLYVGTTRNSILQGSVHTGFSLLVQVSSLLHLPTSLSHHLFPFWFFLTSLPHPFSSGLATYSPFTCSCSITPPLTWAPPRIPLDPATNKETASVAEGPQDPRTPLRLCCASSSDLGGVLFCWKCHGRWSHALGHIPPRSPGSGIWEGPLESAHFSPYSSNDHSSLLVCQNPVPTHLTIPPPIRRYGVVVRDINSGV